MQFDNQIFGNFNTWAPADLKIFGCSFTIWPHIVHPPLSSWCPRRLAGQSGGGGNWPHWYRNIFFLRWGWVEKKNWMEASSSYCQPNQLSPIAPFEKGGSPPPSSFAPIPPTPLDSLTSENKWWEILATVLKCFQKSI